MRTERDEQVSDSEEAWRVVLQFLENAVLENNVGHVLLGLFAGVPGRTVWKAAQDRDQESSA